MKNPQISLKPIVDLLVDDEGRPRRFWIPSYQRGFRWKQLQVRHLLDDIWDFAQKSDEFSKDGFYCLQPIVIRIQNESRIEVIDGQQRLTTIYLILTFLKNLTLELGHTSFELEYETRGEANEPFLTNIDYGKRNENIDYFHMCEAYNTIEKWFENRGSRKLKFLQHLLNDDETGRNIKFIWYQLPEQDNPIEAFTRLNVGKIPLTNDELIRALFLRQNESNPNDDSLKLKIANEWDQLEKSLQSDSFWYFLSNDVAPSQNRIGFLFDLVARDKALSVEEVNNDAFGVFFLFNHVIDTNKFCLGDLWREIKKTFMLLDEWYTSRTLYHIIGFLIQQKCTIAKLQQMSRGCTKTAFHFKLLEEIYRNVIGDDRNLSDLSEGQLCESVTERLEEWEYGANSREIKKLLILFNIATLLANEQSTLRFEFDYFKQQDAWDIEHIRSTAYKPDRPHLQRQWLEHCKNYFQSQNSEIELQEKIEQYFDKSNADDSDNFDYLFEQILDHFEELNEDETVDNISNLTLLDPVTNRSFQNAVFAVKRQRVLALDREGTYVPLCTRNVFLKYYSQNIDPFFIWSRQDQNDYGNAIVSTLVNFFQSVKME